VSEKEAVTQVSFEQGMERLESLVRRLAQGNLPLEDSQAAFEEGVGMLRVLHEKLGEVERRVEVLMRDADGVLRVGTAPGRGN
jgi:exodeoxyribonuclease VII small subunit